MTKNNIKHPQVYVKRCREELQAAEISGDKARMATAHANLGYALCNIRSNEEGLFQFDLAVELAEDLQDRELMQSCLSLKVLAYQTLGWLPDAYKTAGEILTLAESAGDKGMSCDALLSQGQIMLESGEPFKTLEHYQAARDIALEQNDRKRMMNVMGAFGNYALQMAETGKAREYFLEARLLAGELRDKSAEIGFLGNEAIMLAYHGSYAEAEIAFGQVLDFAHDNGDKSAELQVLGHLVQVNVKRGNHSAVINHAQQGVPLAAELNDSDKLFDFYQAAIVACYQANRIAKAEALTEEAVAAARVDNNKDKEVDFLLSLGESALNSGMPHNALAAYEQARQGTIRLSRQVDDAYLTGRIGVTLAELGRVDEAISYHKEAVDLARKREIPQLEGEQLSMLALAYLDKEDPDQASIFCQSAIDVFTTAELEDDAAQAEKLLAEISC